MEPAVICTLIFLSCLIRQRHTQDIPRPVLTLQHDFAEIYLGETVTLRCDIQSEGGGGGGVSESDWEHKWFQDGHYDTPIFSSSEKEYKDAIYTKDIHLDIHFIFIEGIKKGNFSCMGVRKNDSQSSPMSNVVEVTVYAKPSGIVTVSPSKWLRAGDTATLSCEVDSLSKSSTGWRFYWYKAIPYAKGLPSSWDKSFSVEALADGQRGAGGSLSLGPVNQTHIEAYVCRAGRGDPEYLTHYDSHTQLLWVTGSSPPSATLRFSPNRVQHFSDKPFTVSCEGHGNSTGWRVKRFIWSKGQSECGTDWGTATGSSCYINDTRFDSINAVFWCQSDSGELSDAGNSTERTRNVLLESPVLPVTKGDSVTLACRYRMRPDYLGAEFYKYDSLISTEATGEMTIYSVSQSDEGRYWCEHPELGESTWSWLSVRASSVSLHLSQALSTWLLCAFLVMYPFSWW